MKITAIVSRHQGTDIPEEQQPRYLESVDEFVTQLRAACNAEIRIIEGPLDLAPRDGIILVFDAAGLRERPEIAKRTVLINADRAFVLRTLEEHSLVAAVEKQRYFLWRTNRSVERGNGVFGKKRIANKIQAKATPGPFSTERYTLLNSDHSPNLTDLLGKYLIAYANSADEERARFLSPTGVDDDGP